MWSVILPELLMRVEQKVLFLHETLPFNLAGCKKKRRFTVLYSIIYRRSKRKCFSPAKIMQER